MALSRDQILAADDLPRTEVYVEKWGGSVFLRHLTYEEALKLGDDAASIIVLTAVDEAGQQLFTAEDIPNLKRKNVLAIQALMKAALDLNGMSKDSVKDAEKNSAAGQT